MRILLMWSYYDAYLRSFYERYKLASTMPYAQQLDCFLGDYFDWPPRLIPYFRQAGHVADIIVANARPLQQAWARENDVRFDESNWQVELTKEQIRRFRPDILWGNLTTQYSCIIPNIKPFCGRLFAWRATPIWDALDNIALLDCILTPKRSRMREYVDLGVRSELVFPCFEPKILDHLPEPGGKIDVSFVGSFARQHHAYRLRLLITLAQQTPIQIWGQGWKVRLQRRPWPWKSFIGQIDELVHRWPLLTRYRGEVWGLDMYTILRQSRMTVNIHGDLDAFVSADNIRLFEAAGVGTMLLTESAPNLPELFNPGEEVVAYTDQEDLVRKINYFLENDNECCAIAQAGQKRVLRQHTADRRAKQVLDLFQQSVL